MHPEAAATSELFGYGDTRASGRVVTARILIRPPVLCTKAAAKDEPADGFLASRAQPHAEMLPGRKLAKLV
jgi:hypothetical protein